MTRAYASEYCTAWLGHERALSIRQPWAWLIVEGFKDFENRSKFESFTGRVLIHASLKFDDNFDHIRATLRDKRIEIPDRGDLPTGGIVGAAEFGHWTPRSKSEWSYGPGYPIKSALSFALTKIKGRLGFFTLPAGFVINI